MSKWPSGLADRIQLRCAAMVARLAILRQVRHPSDAWLFLRIFLFALAVPALLRLNRARLSAILRPSRPVAEVGLNRIDQIVTYVDGAMRLGRPLLRPKCTTRGLTLYHFLRRAGLDLSLWFGVESMEGQLHGHCWLVHEGAPFLEEHDPRPLFTPVFTLPYAHAAAKASAPVSARNGDNP